MRNSTSVSARRSFNPSIVSISRMHGVHQDAQRLMKRTFPLNAASSTCVVVERADRPVVVSTAHRPRRRSTAAGVSVVTACAMQAAGVTHAAAGSRQQESRARCYRAGSSSSDRAPSGYRPTPYRSPSMMCRPRSGPYTYAVSKSSPKGFAGSINALGWT